MDDSKIQDLKENVKEYITIRAEIMKLRLTNKLSGVIAKMMFGVIGAVLALLLIIFGSMSVGYYFAALTGKLCMGFLIVAGIYLVVGLIIYIGRRPLVINPIKNVLIKQILADEE